MTGVGLGETIDQFLEETEDDPRYHPPTLFVLDKRGWMLHGVEEYADGEMRAYCGESRLLAGPRVVERIVDPGTLTRDSYDRACPECLIHACTGEEVGAE